MSVRYSSPLVSCIICRKEKSTKGIFSHFITSHTPEGNSRVKQSGIKGAETFKSKLILPTKKEISYYTNPNYCVNCKSELSYSKKNNKFCSSNCSASYNNIRRDKDIYKKQRDTLCKTLSVKSKRVKNAKEKTKIEYCKFSHCVVCKSTIKHKKTKTCSDKCMREHLSMLASNRQLHPQNGKTVIYNGIKLGSGYELTTAKSLDENLIRWTKPSPIKYIDPNGKLRNYFPDFFLPDYNVYLDPKNDFLINHINPETGYKDTDKIKWAEDYNSVKIIILNKHQLDWKIIKDLL